MRPSSVPPSFARRLLLSRAIKASNPCLTKAVFSLIPVNWDAFLRMSSSMFKVVLICIYMHHLGIFVNRKINDNNDYTVCIRQQIQTGSFWVRSRCGFSATHLMLSIFKALLSGYIGLTGNDEDFRSDPLASIWATARRDLTLLSSPSDMPLLCFP